MGEIVFTLDEDTRPEPPEETPGKWVIECPHCGVYRYGSPGCSKCEDGYQIIDAIRPFRSCGLEDHKWELEIDAGSVFIRCLNPHTRQEQEAMARYKASGNQAYNHLPVCLDIDTYRDMLSFSAPVKLWVQVDSDWETRDTSAWVEMEIVQ